MSTLAEFKNHANFLRMQIYNTAETTECGPDFRRLFYRYEVTNGRNNDPEIEELRRLSYLMMLGRTKKTLEITPEIYKDKLVHWYEYVYCVQSVSERYKVPEIQVH